MTFARLKAFKQINGHQGLPDDYGLDGVMRFDVSMFGLYGFMCYAHAKPIGPLAGFLTPEEFEAEITILGSRVREAINQEIRKYVLEHAPYLEPRLVEGGLFESTIISGSLMAHRELIHWELD